MPARTGRAIVRGPAVPLVLAVVLAALPWLGLDVYWNQEIVLTIALALLASGLNLSFGYAGELGLGQVAIYAAGAYVSGYVALTYTSDIFVSLLVAIAVSLVLGLITGYPGLRLGGWALAMTSFFLVLLVPDLVNILQRWTNGTIGLVGIPPLTLTGQPLDSSQYYLFAVIVATLWFAFFRNLVTSRHGKALLVLRRSPVLAASLGIGVRPLKLKAYALGAVPCGIAGVLFANLDHFVSPSDPGPFTITTAIAVLAASVLGGSTSVYGAIVGAAIIQLGPLRLSSFNQYTDAVDGAALIAFGLLLSDGLSGVATRLATRVTRRLSARRPAVASTAAATATATAPAHREWLSVTLSGVPLEADKVSKRFGGNAALSRVSLRARPGAVTAIIGPNGSGKTTLLNMICGFYRLDSGTITLGGASIGGRPPHKVAAAGVARTFQTPFIPSGLTVTEAVAAGRYATAYTGMLASVLRLPAHWRSKRADGEAARQALAVTGIAHLAGEDAASQPLGIRRLIEVARLVAASPKVVLFDEIASGLDDDEVADLAQLTRELAAAGGTVILVEHNFGLVLDVADEIYVLANGEVVASGPPAEIRSHPTVLREYLGVAPESLAPVSTDSVPEPGQ
ncbi:MAG: branched-chain amino acid transporter substrate-binding protein [Actinomycetia bacterium]|nr:branched-chain amino acid transporter substrate-binding protein [Actinomycetes bacterium]